MAMLDLIATSVDLFFTYPWVPNYRLYFLCHIVCFCKAVTIVDKKKRSCIFEGGQHHVNSQEWAC